MNTSIEISLILLITSAFLILMLEALSNRSDRPSHYENPHIKLLTLGALFSAFFIILLDLSAQSLLSRRPLLFFDSIATLFLLTNTIISIHIGQKTFSKIPSKDIFFLIISSLITGIFTLCTNFLLIKMLGSVCWFLIMAALANKTTEGGRKAEIALKLSYNAIFIFLLFIFAFYFLSYTSPVALFESIQILDSKTLDPSFIGLMFLILAGLSLGGIPPFSFAHIDCADGSNLSTGFLIISNSMILGASMLIEAKKIILLSEYKINFWLLGLVLVIGLLIAWLRALDQSKIRRCITYIAISVSPLFCLSLLFGTSALLPQLIYLFVMFIFSTSSIFALYGSLAYLEPLDSPWQTWEDMAGLGRSNKIQALYLLVALASVSGLPGTLGYFVKLSLIAPMQENDWFNLLVFASIALGAACCMRFFVFLFSKHELGLSTKSSTPPISLLASAVILIILGFFPFVR